MPTVEFFDENFEVAIKRLETHEYSAEVNLAAGFKSFVRFVRDSEPYIQLAACLKFDRERYGLQIQKQIQKFVQIPNEPEYEHPSDSAIATLLIALIDHGFHRMMLATHVGIGNWFWTDQVLVKEFPK